jgi:PAS domain S-box-containing protein
MLPPMKHATRKSGRAKIERKSSKTRKATPSPPDSSPAPPVQSEPVAIVGVGASAGGLEAFTQLLRALSPDTGMAFVLVQHLEASHESMLTKLLSSATKMPIAEVTQGVRVEPNHVYIIPPNADLQISGGMLQIALRKAPKGHHLPIDHFFRSLAEDKGSGAIGIILSGTASDGTLGLKAIKAQGGITFAQDPRTAKFDGMPTNAISAGCVDFVQAPEAIAAEIGRISRHPYVGTAQLDDAVPALPARDDEWLRIFRLLKTASTVDFTFYKKSTIKRRVARRMALHKIATLSDYLKYVQSDPDELDALYRDILIHVTSFFREPEVFRDFQARILPRIFSSKPAGEPFRMWIAGCSTGEEAYSLAICLLEHIEDRAPATPVQIFATDVSEEAIEKARLGTYSVEALSEVTPDRLKHFFTRADGHYQINSSARELCVFARHDITKDPPFSRLDLISCRNVLIYLEPVIQKRILASFHYALKDTGMLLLGKSETLGSYPDLFSVVDRKSKFFIKKGGMPDRYDIRPQAFEAHVPREKQNEEEAAGFDIEKEADRVVWERYAHAGLLVNSGMQILHFRGDTSPYLRPAPGKATFHLLRMLRDELVFELRACIHKARQTGETVRREGIQIKRNGSVRDINVEVRSLPGPGAGERYFLILFDELTPPAAEAPPAKGRRRGTIDNRELLKVKTELARTKEYLQSVIQEQESTNEELKTANEEALSSMEELQSANEELETAKEELQSTNEELVTLNEQLQNRNTELALLGDDLNNVLSGVNIPILMLDGERRIRRFTPTAEKLLHLLPGDIGRPLGDIRLSLDVPDLDELISGVIGSGRDVQREVKGTGERWYSIRLSPYMAKGRTIDGVLISFVDIHQLKQIQEAARREESLVSAILDAAARDLLVLVMDGEGRIVRFNRACQDLTGYSQEEVAGKRAWDFLLAPGDVATAKVAFEGIQTGTPIRREDYWITKDGGRRLISWSSSRTPSDTVHYVVATGIDITERHDAQEESREKEATVQALLESAAQAIMAYDSMGRMVLVNASAEKMFGYNRQELISMTIEHVLPESVFQPNTRRGSRFNLKQARSMGEDLELTGLRKDGTEFPVEITFSHIETKDGALGVSFVSDVTERKKAQTALLKYQQELRDLAARLLSIQEAETQLLARDLHDDLSQKLAAFGMEASTLAKSAAESPASIRERIRDLGQRISGLSDDVHRLSRQLHPAILDDLGLEAALREECLSFSRRTGIPVQFQTDSVPRSVQSDIALCLFRVAQESLRNIWKHANAGHVRMVLARHKADLALLIEDKGDGFNVEEARGRGGLGLISMEERVRLVNGEFSIRSDGGKGTEIEVHVPLDSAGS